MAVCSLFLASKWDDQPIFMEHIIKLLYILKPAKFPKEVVKHQNALCLTY